MIVPEPVQATIWFALNHYAYNDAVFLAERLHAEVATEESLYLLATCYYRAGKSVAAYSILCNKSFNSSECRLLLARCCCDLKKFSEAEEALLAKCIAPKTVMDANDLVNYFNEGASFAAQLLAFICGKTERYEKALDYYKKSLKLNPFLWSSFENLIQLGSQIDSAKVFNISNVDFNLCHGSNPLVSLWNSNAKVTETQHSSQPETIKSKTQCFEIHSPFAVLKSNAATTGSIDVITPDSNTWVAASCLAPQKPPTVRNSARKPNTIPQDHVTPTVVSRHETPTGRLSFGVFPLADTPLSTVTTNENDMKQPPAVENLNKIPKAPVKKPQTRRGQQNPTVVPAGRMNKPKLQTYNQSMYINAHGLDPISSLHSSPTSNNQTSVSQSGGLRRSSRLFNSSSSVKENSKSTVRSTNQENNKKTTNSRTPTKKTKRQISATTIVSSNQQKETELNELNKPEVKNSLFNVHDELKQVGLKLQKGSAEGLLNLLAELGKASFCLGQFKCQESVDVLINLPSKHFNSGWVLTTLGKAYFEMSKYEEAVQYFEDARAREPHRLQGTEYYSTALWHLQREVKLSMLSQELIEFDKNAPQTWCVAGNCFSLQKEHETAIKFLQRAIQVDPDFAYAYTLLGHELVLTEEMDHAMACFRNAIRIDPRHYNAWYGIGMIYYKQEKYQLAELHYRKALKISPCNPVLMCHIGVVQHSLKRTDSALLTLNKAIEMDSKNALCKFHRASIYFAMDKHTEALKELDELKQIVPKESLVYFLIGKVHKRLGNTHLALMNFSWAMDLDPKGANNQIKEVIDKQYANDEDDVVVCLDAGDDTSVMINGNVDSSLRLQSQSHGESSSMDGDYEDVNYDSSEVMDEGV